MSRAIGKKQALALMAEGWELRHHAGYHGRYVIQRGTDMVTVRADAAVSFIQGGEVEAMDREPQSPWWLTRYKQKAATP